MPFYDRPLLGKLAVQPCEPTVAQGAAVGMLWSDDNEACGKIYVITCITGCCVVSVAKCGATAFLGLTDTPSSFTSQALKLVRVNSTPNALEFIPIACIGGDFNGPACSTDNAIVRFDGAGGKTGQNSGILISDSNVLTLAGDITRAANQSIDLTGAATRTLTLLNSTSCQVANLHISDGILRVGACAGCLDTVNVDGNMDIHHTAVAADEHSMEFEHDAAGFGDSKAIDIEYTTGNIGTGEEADVIFVNIDEFASTGGEVIAMTIVATEGCAEVHGLEIGATVSPIVQFSGLFSDMDSALVCAVDKLACFISTCADVTMFPCNCNTVTIGDLCKFEELEFILATVASGGGIAPTFEFSTGCDTWTGFTPADGTNGMRNSGVIIWDDDLIPTWAIGLACEYLIRIKRNRVNVSTDPIEDKVQIAKTTRFNWDKCGIVTILTLKADTISERTAAAGVTIDGVLLKDSLIGATYLPDASATAQGVQENAIAAEVSTGTALTLTVTPDALAGSEYGTRIVGILVHCPNCCCALTTGNGKAYFRVPSVLCGYNLVDVEGSVTTASSCGVPTIQLRRVTAACACAADMLSTLLTIDACEKDSSIAAAAPAINTCNDDVATGQKIHIDVDIAGTGTKGLYVETHWRLP